MLSVSPCRSYFCIIFESFILSVSLLVCDGQFPRHQLGPADLKLKKKSPFIRTIRLLPRAVTLDFFISNVWGCLFLPVMWSGYYHLQHCSSSFVGKVTLQLFSGFSGLLISSLVCFPKALGTLNMSIQYNFTRKKFAHTDWVRSSLVLLKGVDQESWACL